jgi:hypothetical protein
MKQLLTAATIATLVAAPALATPIDALTLYVLLGAAALGSSLINEAAFSELPRAAARVYARINHSSYIHR